MVFSPVEENFTQTLQYRWLSVVFFKWMVSSIAIAPHSGNPILFLRPIKMFSSFIHSLLVNFYFLHSKSKITFTSLGPHTLTLLWSSYHLAFCIYLELNKTNSVKILTNTERLNSWRGPLASPHVSKRDFAHALDRLCACFIIKSISSTVLQEIIQN